MVTDRLIQYLKSLLFPIGPLFLLLITVINNYKEEVQDWKITTLLELIVLLIAILVLLPVGILKQQD